MPLYEVDTFVTKLTKIKNICKSDFKSDAELDAQNISGLKLLNHLTIKMNPIYIDSNMAETITWCNLVFIKYFHSNINPKEYAKKNQKVKVRYLQQSVDNLHGVAKKLKHVSKIIDATTLKFLNESDLWSTESLCKDIINKLMSDDEKAMQIVTTMLDVIENIVQHTEEDGRLIIKALSKILADYKWMQISTSIVHKLLNMFYFSVRIDKYGEKYLPLRQGLEVCIKGFIKTVPNEIILLIINVLMDWVLESVENDLHYEFGIILQIATSEYLVTSYTDSFTTKLFDNIIHLIEYSNNSMCSLLGHKIFQNLIDRQKNANLIYPGLYFLDMQYNMNIGQSYNSDELFMEKYREAIHNSFIACIKQHGKQRGIVESVFTSMALMIIEVKCGLTAAANVCIAMNIQEYFLSVEFDNIEYSHRGHAIVMSILSFVCWFHHAEIFYQYLYEIMNNRAYYAPFLNPPIKSRYQYAENHVLWNKQELFFEDWQVRYGIWKCFRRPATRNIKPTITKKSILQIKGKKPTKEDIMQEQQPIP